jgi:hypothetical protein
VILQRLQRYTLQTRSGIGQGPLIGFVSTAFSRVVLHPRSLVYHLDAMGRGPLAVFASGRAKFAATG